eukprot:1389121-Rhodomonas_salina.2
MREVIREGSLKSEMTTIPPWNSQAVSVKGQEIATSSRSHQRFLWGPTAAAINVARMNCMTRVLKRSVRGLFARSILPPFTAPMNAAVASNLLQPNHVTFSQLSNVIEEERDWGRGDHGGRHARECALKVDDCCGEQM